MTDGFKLSPQQKRIWFLQQASTAFRAQCEIAIDGPVDVGWLRGVVRQIVERHEILRTTFEREPGVRTPMQVIGAEAAFSFHVDRRGLKIDLPALCADASTLRYFFDELCQLYAGHAVETEPMQYADFAAWQNELLESEAANAGVEFWKQRDIPRALLASESFQPVRFKSDNDYKTDRATLEACWVTLLWRLQQQPELVLGHVFDGRNYDELKGAFGPMSRCVPLRIRMDQHASLIELSQQIAKEIGEMEQWQEFWTWSKDVGTEHVRAPHLPYVFEYQEMPASYEAGDLRFTVADMSVCSDRYNLKLVATANGDTLKTEFHYDPNVVSSDAVCCLADQFQEIVTSALADPNTALSKLQILSDRERRRLVFYLNETAHHFSDTSLVHQLFEQQASSAPDQIAVVCDDDRISFGELNARANQLAHHLHRLGIGPETAVVLNVERSVNTLVGMLAILKAGGAYVPLEGAQPSQRLAAILEETTAPVIVTQASLRDQFSSESTVCIDSDWPAIANESSENPNAAIDEANLVYIIYTSGSTGRPKGVAVEHRQLSNYLQAIKERVGVIAPAAYASVSTFAADLGNTTLFLSLCNGGTLHLITKQRATDAASLADYFTQNPIDYLKVVPSHLEALLAHDHSSSLLPRRCLLLGGEATTHTLIQQVRELAPDCEIFNHYGPTETTVGILTCHVDDRAIKSVPLGRPLANNTVYLLNPRLEPVAVGEFGEVFLGGAQVTRGYIRAPSITAERFVPNPYALCPGERLYRTGDLGRFLPDGKVEFAGRADSQIKLHGYRVELGEIRYALNQHAQINDSVAVVHRDENQQEIVVAYYIAGQAIDDDELRTFLADYLASHAIPNVFHWLVKFPLNSNGKIDLHSLTTNGKTSQKAARRFLPPTTAMEELLAGLWTRLLNVKHISTDDNFFTLGGHSLLATRIVSQLHKLLHVEVPFTALFESPTLGGTAKRLEALVRQQRGLETLPITRVSRDGELPLSFAQQRLWFLDQLQPNSAGYNNASALRLKGPLDVKALEQTFSEIVRRHEILRTSFRSIRGNPVQVIEPFVSVSPKSNDSSLHDEAKLARLISEETAAPFDLATAPLWRVKLLQLGPEDHVLIVTMHHIVTDAWSNGVFMREASTLYNSFVKQQPASLPELPVQYADFAAWQHQLLAGEQLEKHLTYWRQQLRGPLPMLELPTDRPRADVRTFHGARQTVGFEKELTDELRTFSRDRGVTLFMTLVAAFKVLLHHYTKQDDVVIGTDVANRNRTETEALIGFFVNQLVLRTDLSENPTFGELLERVRDVALGAYTHQDLPFDRLVEALKPERNLKYAPFFEVKLVLENTSPVALNLTGLTIEPLEIETTEAKLDLILVLRERPEGLQGWFEYNRDLFNAATVVRFGEHLELLLRRLLAAPDVQISDLQEAIAESDRERRAREQQQYESAWRRSFRNIKPQPVTVTSTDR